MFNWGAFADAMADGMIVATRKLLADSTGETPYAVALFGFYAETTGPIHLPCLALATEESVQLDHRFSPPDWEHIDYDWMTTPALGDLQKRLVEAVDGLPRADWEEAHARYEQVLLAGMARVKQALISEGEVAPNVVCFLDDEDGRLFRLSVTPEELAEHFPHIVEAEAAQRELTQLPVSTQVERLARAAGLVPGRAPESGPLSSETAIQLLLALGSDAVPAGLAGLVHPETRWKSARLLADLHQPIPEVLDALRSQLSGSDLPGHHWVARALARLGAGHELLERSDLPSATVASGIAAPYGAFRDDAVAHLPLDYALLSAGLARDDLAPLLAEEFAPGRGECTPDAADFPGALAGLDSPHAVVRRHAVSVLSWAIGPMGQLDLAAEMRTATLNRIRSMAVTDEDEHVRFAAWHGLRFRTPSTD
ncbi:MAG TPA: DUF4303 domain-containing protein [Ktedonobacterales bacterium]|nr:DUF4303 domain-containing protein [Ktedonobacterales bacterium]